MTFQFVNGLQDLSDLIGLGFTSRVLDIDARVASPRDFENDMAAAALPWLAKVRRADLVEFAEAHGGGLEAHLFEKFFKARHMTNMVPLLAPLVKSGKRERWQAFRDG